MALVSCCECSGRVSTSAVSCPHCGAVRKRRIENESPSVIDRLYADLDRRAAEARESSQRELERQRNLRNMGSGPACPSCQSRNTEKMGLADRLTGGGFIGTAGKTHKCKSCGRMF